MSTSGGMMKADMRGLKAKLDGYRRNTPAARLAGARELARVVVDRLLELTPRDTGALRNGWRKAAEAAELGLYPAEPMRESRYIRRWIRGLRNQYRRWERLEQAAIARGDSEKEIRRLGRLKAKALDQLGRFFEQRENRNIELRVVQAGGRNINLTIRTQVYGGTAAVSDNGSEAFVLLRNREPHASQVEKQKRPLALAMAVARQVAAARVRRLVVKKLKASKGAAAAAAAA